LAAPAWAGRGGPEALRRRVGGACGCGFWSDWWNVRVRLRLVVDPFFGCRRLRSEASSSILSKIGNCAEIEAISSSMLAKSGRFARSQDDRRSFFLNLVRSHPI
jgi:hypothetical protein